MALAHWELYKKTGAIVQNSFQARDIISQSLKLQFNRIILKNMNAVTSSAVLVWICLLFLHNDRLS